MINQAKSALKDRKETIEGLEKKIKVMQCALWPVLMVIIDFDREFGRAGWSAEEAS